MADGYISQIKTPDNKVYLLKDSEKGYKWNAVTQGQKWSRICLITPTVTTEGSSGILSISCTRGSVVCNATFLITTSHASKCFINALGTTNYSAVRIRGVVQSNGTAYIELYDTANSIASGTTQTWHCSYIPILSSTVTTYTAFTDGTTLPSGYTAVNDFTAPQGNNSAPVVSISRSGTTFTATRSNGSTFTFTQQDNAGITSVTIGATSPVQSSTSTAQTGSSASTTISLKDAYGDTKNPYGTKAKNLVLAGPSSGSNAVPTFRALVAADIPNSILKWQTTTAESTALYDFGVYVNMNNANSSSMTSGNFFNILNVPYRKASGNTKADWGWQLGNTTSNDGRLWYRTSGDNVWGDWQTIAHATQSTSDTGSSSQPVYMTKTGVITAITAVGAAYGGTGKTTLKDSANTLINALETGSSPLTANDYVITQYVGGGTTTTTYHRRPASQVVNGTLVKAALGIVGTTAKKFLKDTGAWTQVAFSDLSGTATNAQLANSKVTIAGNDVSLGGSLTAATLTSSLGLSNALHFIGITSTALADGSTTATLTAKSTNSLSKTTGFVDGDVVMDGDQLREYVWSGSAWRLLGITTSTAYKQPASTATNTWIAQVSQGTDGKITATTGSLNTSGTWSGNATTATTATNLANNPSIQTASNSNQITITAGGKTSSAYTVPYATSAGSATSATTATYIKCTDTRSAALNPTDLNAASGVRFDFKAKGTISLTATDLYAGVMSFRPYASGSDWSGGNAHQIAFNSEGLHWRNGGASWGNWYQILDSNNTAAGANATANMTWGQTYTLARINGTDIKVTMPSNPNTNTTYTFAEGSTNGAFSVTPSGGSAQSVSIHGLEALAYKASLSYSDVGAAPATHTHNYAGSSSAGGSATESIALLTASVSNTSADGQDARIKAAIKSYFDNNKANVPRGKTISLQVSTGNGVQATGYFISGYDSNPYGGFFVSHYDTPRYVGVSNGNYSCYELVRNNGGGYNISISGNAATATTATNLSAAPTIASGGTATVNLSANTAYTLTVGGQSVIFKTPADGNTDTKVNVTATAAAITKNYLLMTSTAPTSTATGHTALGSTCLWVNAVDKGKFELVLGNSIATTTAGGQFGQLALYSASSAGTYLKAADGTAWKTQTLQAKDGTIALTSDIPTNLNQLTNGPGYTTNTGTVTSVKLIQGAGITVSSSGTAITTTGERTISITGMDTTNGSTTQWLNKKGGWSTPTAAQVGALASSTVVTNVAISADTTTNKEYALVFGTTPSDGTSPTAAKTEGLQKNITKLYTNPSTGTLYSTKFCVDEHVTLQYNTTDSSLEFVFA